MSLFSTIGISAVATALDTVLFKQGRKIGSIIPDCVISEEHHDSVEVTEHPVERGANLSDHAFRRQAELRITAAWSESKSVPQLIRAGIGALTGNGTSISFSMSDVYDQLRLLQGSLQPFDIVTGKRSYKDMMFTGLHVTTDKDTENVLMVEASFKEVLLVDVTRATLPPVLQQLNPAATAAPVNLGQQQAQASTLVTDPSKFFGGA